MNPKLIKSIIAVIIIATNIGTVYISYYWWHNYYNTEKITEPSNVEKISRVIQLVYNTTVWESDVYAFMTTKFIGDWYDYVAMLYVESKFKAHLTSNKNCKGIAQLHENTMKSICKELNIPYYEDIIWHDIHNITAGFYYLQEAMKTDYKNRFRIYIGGPKWQLAKKENEYIEKYTSDLERESAVLKYVYKGID